MGVVQIVVILVPYILELRGILAKADIALSEAGFEFSDKPLAPLLAVISMGAISYGRAGSCRLRLEPSMKPSLAWAKVGIVAAKAMNSGLSLSEDFISELLLESGGSCYFR